MASFHNAAVTKVLMVSLGGLSLACSMFDIKHYLHLQLLPHISRDHQYWRLILYQFASDSSADLLLFELLLFNVSITVERIFGSVRYASFVFVVMCASAFSTFAVLVAARNTGLNRMPPGPFSLLFAMLLQYHQSVPPAYSIRIFSISVSNKFFYYILAFQLATTNYPSSAVAGVVGVLICLAYQSDIFSLRSYRIPLVIQRPIRRLVKHSIGSTRPVRMTNQAVPDSPSERPPQIPRSSQTDNNEAATPPPSDDINSQQTAITPRSVVRQWVNQLTGREVGLREPSREEMDEVLGMFPNLPRQTVLVALQRSPNTDVAVEALLNSTNREQT